MEKIWNFFISRRRFVNLIIVVIFLLGIVSIYQIPKESMPEVDIPYVIVSTPFPGASAEDVEEIVTNVLEDRLSGLEGVNNMTSVSSEGFSNIVLEFDPSVSVQDRKEKVEEKVDNAKSDLPENAEDSNIQEVDISETPVLIFSFSGPYNIVQLNKFADSLKNDIEQIPEIAKVDIIGGQEREVRVLVDRAKLDRFGLSISQVTGAIQSANANIPVGSIKGEEKEFTVRLAGRITDVEDIEKIPVISLNNNIVSVEDIAEVVDGYKEQETISNLSVNREKPLTAVTINISKTKGGNIVSLVDEINEKIKEAKESYLPENLKIEVLMDMGDYVKQDLNTLAKSFIETTLIVLVILFLFIGLREALVASFAIPLSFLITFIFLPGLGITINFLSLFALILALGILIDTAIVVIERMNIYLRKGFTAKEAAKKTVKEFQWPLISGILTTVCAFFPMLLTEGIVGEFIKSIPITVVTVLISSLFVGLAIIPSIGSRLLKNRKEEESEKKSFLRKIQRKVYTRIFTPLIIKYQRLLSSLLRSKRKQRLLVSVVLVLFFLSLLLPATGILKVVMFPSEDGEFFTIEIKKEEGTTLEETFKEIESIEGILLEDERIRSFSASVGSSVFAGNTGTNYAEIFVNLAEEREEKSYEIAKEYQERLEKTLKAEVSTEELTAGPPSGSPINIGIRGSSLEELENKAKEIEEILKSIPGTLNVKTSIEDVKGEFVIRIDRNKAKLYGISTIELAQVLRNAVSGTNATVIRKEGEEIDVLVKYNLEGNKESIDYLESLTIATRSGDIPLKSFTKTDFQGGRTVINHEEGKRTIRVTAFNKEGSNSVEIVESFKEKVDELNLPEDFEIVYGGEQQDIQESYNSLFQAMILSIFLIGSILILQFRSYRQPLFILISIPLAFIGIFPGLSLIGASLSFPAIIGVVALAGIVVNNGIILIDRINKNREKGLAREESIIEAGESRFRPILLTTMTTIGGILPITLSSAVWGPLGFTIIFGLLTSTFLTLFIVPLIYNKFGEKVLESQEN